MVTSVYAPTGSINSLTLANGMTAGIGPNEQTENKPYDYRQLRNQFYPPLRQGQMRTIPGVSIGATSSNLNTGQSGANAQQVTINNTATTPYILHFLYNPNQVQSAFQIDTSNLPPVSISTSAVGIVPGSLIGQTVSWSLFFDRTYDILFDSDGSRGVLQDVAALYNILGVFDTFGNTALLNPVQVMFGQVNQNGAIWGFTGYISSVNITYGIFKWDMIPSRCEIDLTMLVRYLPVSMPPPNDSGALGPTGGPIAGAAGAVLGSALSGNAAGVLANLGIPGFGPPSIIPIPRQIHQSQ